MATTATRAAIDHHFLRLMVGSVALGLAIATSVLVGEPLQSISASYHAGGAARDVFVGSLVAVGAIMLAHHGHDAAERRLSWIAGLAALGVGLFPCDCGITSLSLVPSVHYVSAAVLFIVLAAFCREFYLRAREKSGTRARTRALLYLLCAISIAAVLLTLGADYLSGGAIRARVTQLVFYGEAVGLVAFGVSWLVASQRLRFLRDDTFESRVRTS